jgi:hypothetical protein
MKQDNDDGVQAFQNMYLRQNRDHVALDLFFPFWTYPSSIF